jgi:hypothetical protein
MNQIRARASAGLPNKVNVLVQDNNAIYLASAADQPDNSAAL